MTCRKELKRYYINGNFTNMDMYIYVQSLGSNGGVAVNIGMVHVPVYLPSRHDVGLLHSHQHHSICTRMQLCFPACNVCR